jgi:polysaccharide biosynthesis protein PslG
VVPTLASTTPEVTSEPLRGYGSPTGPVIDRHLFGLHAPADWVSDIASGFEGPTNPRTIPNVPVGYLRLWDTETTWRDIQPSREQFDWRKLERQIQTAQVLDSKVMYVLGGTPAWAGNGSVTSAPTNIADWRAYVKAVACRFPNSIHSYEIWNEANLQTFWTGSPAEMADLTAAAFQEIRACSPNALVVAASTTTRATGSFATFFPAYLEELKKRNWPADAYSVHTYPTASGNSEARIQGIGQFRTFLALAGAPFTTVFDTEINYGLEGLNENKRNIDGTDAMTLLSRTYIDSARYGFGSTFWYVWTANPDSKFGIQFTPDTGNEQAAWRTTYDWLVGSQYQRCFDTDQKLTVCQFNKGGDNFSIVWRGDVGSAPATMPTGYLTGFGSRSCDLFGNCDVMTNDTRLTIGPMPIRIDGPALAGGGASAAPQPQTPSGEKLAAPTVTDIELIYGNQNKIDAVASWLPPQNATLWRLDRYEYELQYCDGPCKTVNRGSTAPNTTSVRITLPNGPGKYQFVVRATATGFVTSGDGTLAITAISQVQSPQSQKTFTALTTRAAPPSDVVLSVLKDQGKITWRRPGIKADLIRGYEVQIRNISKNGRWQGRGAAAGSSQSSFTASQLGIEIGDTIVARVRTVLTSGLKSPFVASNQQTVNEQVEPAGMFSASGVGAKLMIVMPYLLTDGPRTVDFTCPFPANAVQIRSSTDGVNWTLARYRPDLSMQVLDLKGAPQAGTGDSFIPLCGLSLVSPPDGLEWNSETRFQIRHTNNSGKLPSDWTPFNASFPPQR